MFDGQLPEIFTDRPSRFFTSPQKMPAVQLPSGAKSPPTAVGAACGAVAGAMVPVAEADSGAAAWAADGATSAAAETAARKRVPRFMEFLPAGVFGHARTEGGPQYSNCGARPRHRRCRSPGRHPPRLSMPTGIAGDDGGGTLAR
ncbi:hypothetical protein [Micromonospora musae]|uniref:hypothetical protein n=1 Tax=Micromonospora musae TaxID=1894970 RepID=UPI0033CDE299